MTKDKLKGLFALGILLISIGLILLFSSVKFGTSAAKSWLTKEGMIDTSTYLIKMEGSINIFLASGSVLLGTGLATIIFAYYKILNIH